MDEFKNNIKKSLLSEKELEGVTGGAKAGKSGKKNTITVACGKCGKQFTINSDTTVYICSCGHKNEFFG